MKHFYEAGLANSYFANALEILWPSVQPALADDRYLVGCFIDYVKLKKGLSLIVFHFGDHVVTEVLKY